MEMSKPESNQGFQANDDIRNPESSQNQAGTATETPQKRRPGRPKGSTKKVQAQAVEGGVVSTKVKRPVGRPRKDGFPAGSVPSPRPRSAKQPRHSTGSTTWPASASALSFPQYPIGSNVSQHVPIDPNLQTDDWGILARTQPNAFLSALLNALAAPNPVSPIGPTVQEAFKSHLGSLAPNSSQTLPIPSLYYVLKTFWLPSSPSYFSLTASASTARTPSEHRFLYWDPQPLVFNGIACPSCAGPLINRGRISTGPIKVYDIEKPFFIIGCEYMCNSNACAPPGTSEGRKFASTDSSIFRSLPQKLKDEFPAHLLYADSDAGPGPSIWNWKPMGVSRSLWNLVRGCLRAGLGKNVILQLVKAVQRGVPEDEEIGPSSARSMAAVLPQVGDEEEEDEIEHDVMDVSHDRDKVRGPSGNPVPSSELSNNPEVLQQIIEAYTGGDSRGPNEGTGAAPAPHPVPARMTSTPGAPAQIYDYAKPYGSFPYAAYAFFPSTGTAPPQPEQGQTSTLKRPYPFPTEGGVAEVEGEGTATKRNPRHCCKCGSQECKGKGGRSFCQNGCQDCGKLECKGRNSRRPEKKCDEGWI